ncbi:MAG: hypothetical protein R3D60_06200 [Paracoccaceae bacterium]
MMRNRWSEFLKDDAGSTTADWIVLTAGVVGLSLGAVVATRGGVGSLGQDILSSLRGTTVAGADPSAVAITLDRIAMTGGGCNMVTNTCGNPVEYRHVELEMSDGSTWTLDRTTVWGSPPTDIWKNGSGEPVAAPELAPNLL